MEQQGVVEQRTAATVKLVGDQDIASRDALEQRFEEAAESQNVTVDLSEVTYMDSSAIGAVVALQRAMARKGGHLKVRVKRNAVYRLLDITGIIHVLETETIEE